MSSNVSVGHPANDDNKASLYLTSVLRLLEMLKYTPTLVVVFVTNMSGGWGQTSPWPSRRNGSDYAGIGWMSVYNYYTELSFYVMEWRLPLEADQNHQVLNVAQVRQRSERRGL